MSDNTLFEQSVSRRELLKKVAVYTPPVVFGGSALITAGSAFAAKTAVEGSTGGSTSSECAPRGSSSAGGHYSASVLEALQADLATLIAIPATGVRSVDKKVAEAIGDLTEATNSSQWYDDSTLVTATGDDVFFDLKWAAKALNASGSSDSNVAAVLADVVTQASTLANLAVENACLTGQPAKKAQNRLQNGADRTAAGDVGPAIVAYMHAWDIAVGSAEAADESE